MTKTNNRISTSQLFCLLILTRIAGEIVYPRTISDSTFANAFAVAAAEVIQLLLALPAIIYSFHGENFYGAVHRKNRFFGWVTALTAALLMIISAAAAVFCSSEFAIKNLLNHSSMWVIAVLSAAFAVYTAFMGAEAAARAGSLFLVVAGVLTLAVVLADIEYYRLPPVDLVFQTELKSFVADVIRCMGRSGDYLIFTALLPLTARKKSSSVGKCGLLFGLTAIITTAGLEVACRLVLRDMYGTVEYPFIAAASLADVIFFKRIDGWTSAVWVLCCAFRAGVFLLCAKQAVSSVRNATRREK